MIFRDNSHGMGPSTLLRSQTLPLRRSMGPTCPMTMKLLFGIQVAGQPKKNAAIITGTSGTQDLIMLQFYDGLSSSGRTAGLD